MVWWLCWLWSHSSAVNGPSFRALSSNASTTSSLLAPTITYCTLFFFLFQLHLLHPFLFDPMNVCLNLYLTAGASLGLYSVQNVPMRFSLWNITAAIDLILSYRCCKPILFKLVWRVGDTFELDGYIMVYFGFGLIWCLKLSFSYNYEAFFLYLLFILDIG